MNQVFSDFYSKHVLSLVEHQRPEEGIEDNNKIGEVFILPPITNLCTYYIIVKYHLNSISIQTGSLFLTMSDCHHV